MQEFDCAVIGNWHLAFVTAGVLSQFHKVALVDPEEEWNEVLPRPPVFEPGLGDVMTESAHRGQLHFVGKISTAWRAKIVWLAIDTPVDDNDQPNLAPLWKAIREVAQTQKPEAFVISSQVPVGFGKRVVEEFGLPVVSVPENLRLGKGIETFQFADRTVIGSADTGSAEKVRTLMKNFSTQFMMCGLETAELIKHGTNIFLAMSISFANELAKAAQALGGDCDQLARGLKMDKRIGSAAYVSPGLGFAGGTLPRDIRVVQNIGREMHFKTPLLDAVMEVNNSTTDVIVQDLRANCPHLKHVLILGYTYKADTDTLRRSLSLEIAARLTQLGLRVSGYDPFMNGKDLSGLTNIEHFESLEHVPRPDALLVLTARPAFREIDWANLIKQWPEPPLIYDTQNVVDARVPDSGFAFKKLWQPLRRPTCATK